MRKVVVMLMVVGIMSVMVNAAVVNYRFDESINPLEQSIYADSHSSPPGPTGHLGSTTGVDSDDAERCAAEYTTNWDEGNCLHFGNGKKATAPAGTFNRNLSAFTVETWVANLDHWWSPNYEYLVLKNWHDNGQISFRLETNGGGMFLQFEWYGDDYYLYQLTSDQKLTGGWHHVAITYDAYGGENNFKMYIDGQLNAQKTVSGGVKLRLDDLDFVFGGKNPGYYVDDFRMYDYVIDVPTQSGYVSEFVVPEPATIGLFCLGVVGLIRRQ